MKLTSEERRAKRVFEREIKRWCKILLIDPIWSIRANIIEDEEMGGGDASVDIGTAEYYVANLNIARCLLSLEEEELSFTAANVACHELLHIATADFQRAALVAAGENNQMQEELRYRYEQLVSRFSIILLDLAEKKEGKYELPCRENPKATEELPRVPEVPVGKKAG